MLEDAGRTTSSRSRRCSREACSSSAANVSAVSSRRRWLGRRWRRATRSDCLSSSTVRRPGPTVTPGTRCSTSPRAHGGGRTTSAHRSMMASASVEASAVGGSASSPSCGAGSTTVYHTTQMKRRRRSSAPGSSTSEMLLGYRARPYRGRMALILSSQYAARTSAWSGIRSCQLASTFGRHPVITTPTFGIMCERRRESLPQPSSRHALRHHVEARAGAV
jgi:hypothetical protein